MGARLADTPIFGIRDAYALGHNIILPIQADLFASTETTGFGALRLGGRSADHDEGECKQNASDGDLAGLRTYYTLRR
jgi:hypothetical protein